jgi:preprotein translocase subunit YajC
MDGVTIIFIIFLAIILVWYFMFIRQSRKTQRETQKKVIESDDKLTESNNRLAEAGI